MSGSSAAADVASRRKLEAELQEAKEGLDDTYYSHAKDAQSDALDAEAQAYEETMNRYIEGLRTSLEQATEDMTAFVDTIAGNVAANADIVYNEYTKTGLALDETLTKPWQDAAAKLGEFGSSLDLMNDWTKKGGVFDIFQTKAAQQLKLPWTTGQSAISAFNTSVKNAMKQVYDNVKSNVQNSVAQLNKLKVEMGKIQDTEVRVNTGGGNDDGNTGKTSVGGGNNGGSSGNANVKKLQEILNDIFYAGIKEDGIYCSGTKAAVKNAQRTMKISTSGNYDSKTRNSMLAYIDNLIKLTSKEGLDTTKYKNAKKKLPAAMYAKGTMGTTRDEWAITDESWIGEEITLAAGKNGQLQYLKKGSAVLPSDIAANLVEWGQINPNMMTAPNVGANINMISNAINKPEFNLAFEALVKADRIDESTLPEVKKFVQQEINNLVKQMNYSLKRSGAR